MCITISKGNFGELESQELCFVGNLVLFSPLKFFALKGGTEEQP